VQAYWKVKQSHYRHWQALRVPGGWGSQILRQSAHEGGKVVSTKHQRLYLQEVFLVLISVTDWVDHRNIVRPEELCKWRTPVRPSGMEPMIFRLKGQVELGSLGYAGVTSCKSPRSRVRIDHYVSAIRAVQLQSCDWGKRAVRFVRRALKTVVQNKRNFVDTVLLYITTIILTLQVSVLWLNIFLVSRSLPPQPWISCVLLTVFYLRPAFLFE
jgi:hypothetical protein